VSRAAGERESGRERERAGAGESSVIVSRIYENIELDCKVIRWECIALRQLVGIPKQRTDPPADLRGSVTNMMGQVREVLKLKAKVAD
jgi:hypothetical protein